MRRGYDLGTDVLCLAPNLKMSGVDVLRKSCARSSARCSLVGRKQFASQPIIVELEELAALIAEYFWKDEAEWSETGENGGLTHRNKADGMDLRDHANASAILPEFRRPNTVKCQNRRVEEYFQELVPRRCDQDIHRRAAERNIAARGHRASDGFHHGEMDWFWRIKKSALSSDDFA
ncbi:hypothetical protein HN011_012344 [Eciton burchellii]|nr:hypothetical protein HN011_012344 [Eciton burchellii]